MVGAVGYDALAITRKPSDHQHRRDQAQFRLERRRYRPHDARPRRMRTMRGCAARSLPAESPPLQHHPHGRAPTDTHAIPVDPDPQRLAAARVESRPGRWTAAALRACSTSKRRRGCSPASSARPMSRATSPAGVDHLLVAGGPRPRPQVEAEADAAGQFPLAGRSSPGVDRGRAQTLSARRMPTHSRSPAIVMDQGREIRAREPARVLELRARAKERHGALAEIGHRPHRLRQVKSRPARHGR